MLRILVWGILIVVLPLSLRAQEVRKFQHVDPNWENLNKSFSHESVSASIDAPIINELAGVGQELSYVASTTPTYQLPESEIYNRILDRLGDRYQSIGQDQVDRILGYNSEYNLGTKNFSGFTWQKPMGLFSINLNRSLTPDLYHDTRWIVNDELQIVIDATTFLSNMAEEGFIEPLSSTQLAVFAGLKFKRIFRYYHLADSYTEGLTSDFNKLFFSFTKFKADQFLELDEYDYITKEDHFSVAAGGVIATPPFYYVSFSAGVFLENKKISQVSIQSLGPEDNPRPYEKIRLSYEKEHLREVLASGSAQLDFLGLLKITLLSYEYSYTYSNQQKIYASFNEQDLFYLNTPAGSKLSKEVDKILSLSATDPEVNLTLWPYLTTHEQRKKEIKDSKYLALIWGGLKKNQTEQVEIQKEGKRSFFYKNYSTRLKYTQNLFSKLMNTVFQAIFQTNIFRVKHESVFERNEVMEYRLAEERLDQDPDHIYIEKEEDFSFQAEKIYSARKTTGWFKGGYKRKALSLVDDYSSLDREIYQQLKENHLRGPLQISTKLRVSHPGLAYLHNLELRELGRIVQVICRESANHAIETCKRKIMSPILYYTDEYARTGEMHYNSLKDFIRGLHGYSDRLKHWQWVFGREHVFFNGQFRATTSSGRSFMTYFHEGKFNGNGIISDALRSNQLAQVPTSIDR